MHNAAFQALKKEALYLAFDVAPARLLATLTSLAELGFIGVNLTIPLKEVAFQGIAHLDESARQLRSVNTVKFTSNGLEGFSTDGEGFLRAIQEDLQLSVANSTLFILGCGGAGRAVALAAARAGARRLLLADKNMLSVEKLTQELTSLPNPLVAQPLAPETTAWAQAGQAADLIVQATPCGMNPEEAAPLPPETFRPGQALYDLIYMFPETPLMRMARARGARAANGLGMLLHQGALSFTIWTGIQAPVPAMRQALEAAVYGKKTP